jgi:hypothetical protein
MDSTQGESSWKEELCGINKHDLLKDVIAAAAKNRDVQSVLLPYAAALGIVGDFSG